MFFGIHSAEMGASHMVNGIVHIPLNHAYVRKGLLLDMCTVSEMDIYIYIRSSCMSVSLTNIPICSTYIYHKFMPNVGKNSIHLHGASGIYR